jgi:hypothetical protein
MRTVAEAQRADRVVAGDVEWLGSVSPASSTSSVATRGGGEELGMLGEQRPLVGVIAEKVNRGRELVACGVGAGAEHGHGQSQ